MTVQLQMSGAQRALDATASLTVTDPALDVATVQFMVGLVGAAAIGPFPPTRVSGNVYEIDTQLDAHKLVRVQSVVTLHDGTRLPTQSAVFGVQLEPLGVAPGVLASSSITPASSSLSVAVTMGSAVRWRCYAKLASLPTESGDDRGALARSFLRFEGDASQQSFTTYVAPGTWNCVLLGYNAAGQAGPRRTSAVTVPA